MPASLQASDRSALVFLALGVPLFFPGLLMGQVPGPFAAGVSDTFAFFEPYALELARALRSGGNPFWSHTSAFGAPTLLTLGTGALHPFQLLHLLMPDWLAFAMGWWLRIALFSGYFYAYLRLLDARAWIAFAFTLMVAYGSFFINYSYEIIGFVVAFFPMALYHATKIGRTPRTRDLVLLALAVACMVLGGFPSVVLYLLVTLGAYLPVAATSRRALAFAVLSCCAGVLLALPAIVETLGFYPTSGYSVEQRRSLFLYDPPAVTAFNLVLPAAFGNMQAYAHSGMRDFYGSLLGAGILAVPLLLSLLAYHAVRRIAVPAPTVFWLLVFLLATCAYFNIFQIKQILQHVPVLSEHPLTRLQVLIVLGSAISAALLLEQGVRASPKTHWLAITGLTLGLLALAYAAALRHLAGQQVVAHAAAYGTIGAASLLALGRAAGTDSWPARAIFVGSNMVLGVATSLSYTYYFAPKDYYPTNALITTIDTHLEPGARVLDIGNVLFKNTAVAYGIPSLTNHWFSPPAVRAKVHQVSQDPPITGLTLDVVRSIEPTKAWDLLREMHVQFVSLPCRDNRQWIHASAPSGSAADWRLLTPQADGVCLLEVLWQGRPLGPHRAITGNGYRNYQERPGSIRLLATGTAFTIPVRYHDGWTIVASDADIMRSADGWIAIDPRGAVQQIALDYSPRHLGPWLLPGPLALVLVIAAHLSSTFQRRRRQEELALRGPHTTSPP